MLMPYCQRLSRRARISWAVCEQTASEVLIDVVLDRSNYRHTQDFFLLELVSLSSEPANISFSVSCVLVCFHESAIPTLGGFGHLGFNPL